VALEILLIMSEDNIRKHLKLISILIWRKNLLIK